MLESPPHPVYPVEDIGSGMRPPPPSGPAPSGRSELTEAAARSRLFLSSYAPLFVILAIRFEGWGLIAGCAALAVVGFVDSVHITHLAKTKVIPHVITVTSVEDLGAEVGGYLASYLLPFVTVPNPSARDLAAYALFFLVACVVYVRSDLVRVNPTLYVMGYRVFGVHDATGRRVFVLHRMPLVVGQRLHVVDIAGVLISAGDGEDT